MTVTIDDIRTELDVDLCLARQQLLEARLRQRRKDTPANRAAVAECWTRIDTVLDICLELGAVSST